MVNILIRELGGNCSMTLKLILALTLVYILMLIISGLLINAVYRPQPMRMWF